MLDPVTNKVYFPSMEQDIPRQWEEEDTFAQSLARRQGQKEYVFYDGPPFATGLP